MAFYLTDMDFEFDRSYLKLGRKLIRAYKQAPGIKTAIVFLCGVETLEFLERMGEA